VTQRNGLYLAGREKASATVAAPSENQDAVLAISTQSARGDRVAVRRDWRRTDAPAFLVGDGGVSRSGSHPQATTDDDARAAPSQSSPYVLDIRSVKT